MRNHSGDGIIFTVAKDDRKYWAALWVDHTSCLVHRVWGYSQDCNRVTGIDAQVQRMLEMSAQVHGVMGLMTQLRGLVELKLIELL